MASTARSPSRAASSALQAREQVKVDKRLKAVCGALRKSDREDDMQACEAVLRQVRPGLRVYAAPEEELPCPGAQGALADQDLSDEADVGHELVHVPIDPINHMAADPQEVGSRFAMLRRYGSATIRERSARSRPLASRRI